MTDFAEALMRLWPNGDEKIPGLRAGIIATAPDVFAKWGVNSPLVLAHLMAQISHECGAGHDVVENLSYSAARMREVWPTRFPTIADALPFQKNPRALADKVYGNRMGNRPGTDDGYVYRGRGGSQTPEHDGYAKVQQLTGIQVLQNPDLINDPKNFMECAVADFVACGCLPYAKEDNLKEVTHSLNGGYEGLDSRAQWLKTWKAVNVAVPVSARVIVPTEPAHPPPDLPDHHESDPQKPSGWMAFFMAILDFFRGKK